MKRFLETLILVPIAVVLAVLAVANRTPVSLSLDPFRPEETALTVTVPLYWVIFAALALGVLLGGMAVWMRQGRYRKAARRNRREAAHLREEVETIKKQEPATGPALPAPGRTPLGLPNRA